MSKLTYNFDESKSKTTYDVDESPSNCTKICSKDEIIFGNFRRVLLDNSLGHVCMNLLQGEISEKVFEATMTAYEAQNRVSQMVQARSGLKLELEWAQKDKEEAMMSFLVAEEDWERTKEKHLQDSTPLGGQVLEKAYKRVMTKRNLAMELRDKAQSMEMDLLEEIELSDAREEAENLELKARKVEADVKYYLKVLSYILE